MPAPRVIERARLFARDVIVGVTAAWRSARRIELGLTGMLTWPEPNPSRSSTNTAAERPIRIAHWALRWLARIPGRSWRNTCLFRSVAECDVRRECGVAARIVIGVDTVDGDVVAHSWVEQAGRPECDSRAMRPLHHPRRSAIVV